MTEELLEKGNKLSKYISELESTLSIVRGYKGRKRASRFTVCTIYTVDLPEEVTNKVEMLIEIEIASILAQKKKEFSELGKPEQVKG